MDFIVTKASWECKVPASLRQQGESYWRLAELPLDTESIFIVNAVSEQARGARHLCMLAVSVEHLLDLLERTGADGILSVYVVHRDVEGRHDEIFVDRITAVRAGDSEELGWKKVFIFDTQAGRSFTNADEFGASERLVNETEVIRFKTSSASVRRVDDDDQRADAIAARTPPPAHPAET